MSEEQTNYNPLDEAAGDDLDLNTPATVNAKDTTDTEHLTSLANTGKLYVPMTLTIKDSEESAVYWELPLYPGLEEIIEEKVAQEFGLTTLSDNKFCGQIYDTGLRNTLRSSEGLSNSTREDDILRTKVQATTLGYGFQTHIQIPQQVGDYDKHNNGSTVMAFAVGIVIAILKGKSLEELKTIQNPYIALDKLIQINN